MSSFQFTKMHGLGNDFVVIENITQSVHLDKNTIRSVADRRLGVGCDQILLLSKSSGEADFNYQIFNADGSQAEHCGNGARCLSKFIHDNHLSDHPVIKLQLPHHIISVEQLSEVVTRVSMGTPDFGKPFTLGQETVYPVSIGNPHAVILSDHPATNLQTLGEQFNRNPRFPEGVNVSWAIIRDPNHIDLEVYERGVGFTLACGTAATATVAVAIDQGKCEGEVIVKMPGGECTVEWPNKSELYLSGVAATVYSGVWHG